MDRLEAQTCSVPLNVPCHRGPAEHALRAAVVRLASVMRDAACLVVVGSLVAATSAGLHGAAVAPAAASPSVLFKRGGRPGSCSGEIWELEAESGRTRRIVARPGGVCWPARSP